MHHNKHEEIYVSNNNISYLRYILFIAVNSLVIIKFALSIEPSSEANNFVGPPPASAASIYLRDAWRGPSEWRNVLYARGEPERSLVQNQAESRRYTLIVPGTNNELPAPLSSRRRKTLRNETARWEYEIVACVSARVSSHTYTMRARVRAHTVVSFLAVARYLIFASSPLCWRGKSS